MNRYVFSYDLEYGDHADFKILCIENGFFSALTLPDGKAWLLPSTTLIAWFPSRDAAIARFGELATQAGVALKRLLVAACDIPAVDSDKYLQL